MYIICIYIYIYIYIYIQKHKHKYIHIYIGIQKILRGKAIDVVSLSVPSYSLLNTHSTESETDEYYGEAAQSLNVDNYFNDYFSQISYLCSKFTSLGVDLSTEWLNQVYICMCMYVNIYTYVCVYLCMYIYTCLYIYVSLHLWVLI
jgi:hypothetical protein